MLFQLRQQGFYTEKRQTQILNGIWIIGMSQTLNGFLVQADSCDLRGGPNHIFGNLRSISGDRQQGTWKQAGSYSEGGEAGQKLPSVGIRFVISLAQ